MKYLCALALSCLLSVSGNAAERFPYTYAYAKASTEDIATILGYAIFEKIEIGGIDDAKVYTAELIVYTEKIGQEKPTTIKRILDVGFQKNRKVILVALKDGFLQIQIGGAGNSFSKNAFDIDKLNVFQYDREGDIVPRKSGLWLFTGESGGYALKEKGSEKSFFYLNIRE